MIRLISIGFRLLIIKIRLWREERWTRREEKETQDRIRARWLRNQRRYLIADRIEPTERPKGCATPRLKERDETE